jgi:hypothetical protein
MPIAMLTLATTALALDSEVYVEEESDIVLYKINPDLFPVQITAAQITGIMAMVEE